jgi:tripartite-type tricarboxylate transporter receptor subunit TctC
MNLLRRQFLHLAAGVAALPALSRMSWAQSYPSRPVRIIVGFAPAGGTDIMARLIGQWLSERFGQQFVIENRPGAASNIGTEMVVNAPPDGYTLLVATFVNAVNATLYDKLSFNFIRDIAPVASIAPRAWTGIGAPRNTPAEIVDKLNTEINAALVDPKMKARLAQWGASALPGSPVDFGKLIANETEKWGKVVKFAGIKAD